MSKKESNEALLNQDKKSSIPKKPKEWIVNVAYDTKENPNKGKNDNSIKTSKYYWWNFVPLNLCVQFSKLANWYFLLICFLQTIELISISNGKPAMAYVFSQVVALSMIKDAYEDIQRGKKDKLQNETIVECFDRVQKKMAEKKWKDLKPGDLVKLTKGSQVPADLIALKSDDLSGQIFLETKSLDGETNLKIKMAPRSINNYFTDPNEADTNLDDYAPSFDKHEPLNNMTGTLKSEMPNGNLYDLQITSLQIDNNDAHFKEEISLDIDNLLLRGSSIQVNEYIYGLVIYTGHETKIMKNLIKSQYKHSRLDFQTNISIALILAFQISLALVLALVGQSWYVKYVLEPEKEHIVSKGKKASQFATYLYGEVPANMNKFILYIQFAGTWFLMFTNFVPISLIVQLEICKFLQSFVFAWDLQMYDSQYDVPMRVQASNLNEELGQIEYIFSDKTGTLTQNVMEFKCMTVGYQQYGEAAENNRDENFSQSNFSFYSIGMRATQMKCAVLSDIKLQKALDGKSFDKTAIENLEEYLLGLALCHSVTIDKTTLNYSAASPDEIAFVQFAKKARFEYLGQDPESKSGEHVLIKDNKKSSNEILKFKPAGTCEFTSARRLSSNIYDNEDGTYTVWTKGADSSVLDTLNMETFPEDLKQFTEETNEKFANNGLRCLYLATRIIDQETFEEWHKQQAQAKKSINKDELLQDIHKIVETDMRFIGSTAIEDKLQDEVAETVNFLKMAGIHVWVLTGDKVNTALNIGKSAGLIDANTRYVTCDTGDSINQKLTDVENLLDKRDQEKHDIKVGLVFKGDFLPVIIRDEQLTKKFKKVGALLDIVLACRVAPKQKAEIVQLMMEGNKGKVQTSLAIGDGANDVTMIQAANVGVGIIGREGQQAANSADFAIGQFRFLKRLLMVHGRESYRRNSLLVLYMFYKNALYVSAGNFWPSISTAASGQTMYNALIYQVFNTVMTGLPIMWYTMYDYQFGKDDELIKYVQLPHSETQEEKDKDQQLQELYEKERLKRLQEPDPNSLMQNPNLYKIGITNEGECYSIKIFASVIVRGILVDGLMLYLAVWLPIADAYQENGHDFGMWTAGMTVFCASCFVANLWLLLRFNQHDLFSSFLFFLMACAGHFTYLCISIVFKNFEISHEFFIQTHGYIWLTYLFAILYMFLFEMGKQSIYRSIYKTVGVDSLEVDRVASGQTELTQSTIHKEHQKNIGHDGKRYKQNSNSSQGSKLEQLLYD